MIDKIYLVTPSLCCVYTGQSPYSKTAQIIFDWSTHVSPSQPPTISPTLAHVISPQRTSSLANILGPGTGNTMNTS